MKTTPCGPVMPLWPCRRRCSAMPTEVRRAHGVTVQIRVGLNSGEVVVRAIGNDLHMDYSAVGQTTHLAARMEQLATPGSILLTAGRRCGWWRGWCGSRPGTRPRQGPGRAGRGVRAGRGQAPSAGACRPPAARGLTPLCRAAARARGAAAGPGTGRGRARPGGGGGGRGGRRQVAPGLRVRALPPHPGLAGTGECLGVLRQGHALFPGHRPAQALLSTWRTATTSAPSAPR